MTNREKIEFFLELSAGCGVPPLFMSRPGMGKTTLVENWAKANGYNFVSLIGSRFTPEELGGYQVNDPNNKSLVVKWPTWYKSIMEAEERGQRSVLFIDELNQASPFVQGVLLDLSCSRHCTCGDVPADTIIAAAANYKENIGPSAEDIIPPQANRFLLVSLTKSIQNIWASVGADEEKGFSKRVSPEGVELSGLYDTIMEAQMTFEDTASNQEIVCFDGEEVYGFTSQRTVAYFKRAMDWTLQNGFTKDATLLVAKGLVGGGQGVNPRECWKHVETSIKQWYEDTMGNLESKNKATKGTKGLRLFSQFNIEPTDDFTEKGVEFSLSDNEEEADLGTWMLAFAKGSECPISGAKVHIATYDNEYTFVMQKGRKLYGYYKKFNNMAPVASNELDTKLWTVIA